MGVLGTVLACILVFLFGCPRSALAWQGAFELGAGAAYAPAAGQRGSVGVVLEGGIESDWFSVLCRIDGGIRPTTELWGGIGVLPGVVWRPTSQGLTRIRLSAGLGVWTFSEVTSVVVLDGKTWNADTPTIHGRTFHVDSTADSGGRWAFLHPEVSIGIGPVCLGFGASWGPDLTIWQADLTWCGPDRGEMAELER